MQSSADTVRQPSEAFSEPFDQITQVETSAQAHPFARGLMFAGALSAIFWIGVLAVLFWR